MRSLTELALEKVIKLQNDLEDNELALETLEKNIYIHIYICIYRYIYTYIDIISWHVMYLK